MVRGVEQRFGIGGKVAVVTGGGAGIGEGIAMALGEAGAAVVVLDRNGGNAESVAQHIRGEGGRAVAVAGDVTETATIERALQRARTEFGRLDIVVNNAGIFPLCDFLDIPLEMWDQVFNVNLRAMFQSTQMAARLMREQGSGGAIVNIASAQAFRPLAGGLAHYNTTKAGVVMLTKSAALELARLKIRVNAIAPGAVDTTPANLQATSFTADSSGFSTGNEIVQAYVARTPVGRAGLPADIANLVLFLVSPAADFITGETIIADGGFLLT